MRAESEVRREAVVIGPGRLGFVRVRLGPCLQGASERVVEIEADRIPPALRMPDTPVVAVTGPKGVLRVESGTAARERLRIEERLRRVLNEWDPIGVADEVDDEYDLYLTGVLGLVRSGASDQEIAEHLLRIERDGMGLAGTPLEHRLAVAAKSRETLQAHS